MAAKNREQDEPDTWLLKNRRFIRSVRDGGDGSFYLTPPRDTLESASIDDDDDLVVLPADLAGQLGISKDPLLLVYTLPLGES